MQKIYKNICGLCALVILLTAASAGMNAANSKSIASSRIQLSDTLINDTLREISILTSKVPITQHRQARMVTKIDHATIISTPAQSINDILKNTASFDIRQRGPIGAQTDVGVRGGNYEQVATLLNGINISDPQTGHNSFDLPLSPLQIENIEILEGPSGKISGASSLLGAINIKTMLPDSDKLSFKLEGGSYGYLNASAFVAAKGLIKDGKPQLKNTLSATYTRSDGYSRSEKGNLNMDYEGYKGFYEGQYTNKLLELNWFGGLSSKDWGSNKFYANFDNQFEHTLKSFTAIKGRNLKGALSVNPALYWNTTKDRFELFRGDPDSYPFNYHSTNVYGATITNYFSWIGGTTAFGGELREEKLVSGNLGEPLKKTRKIHGTERYYEYGLNRTNSSLFVEHNIIKEDFTISAAILGIKNSWADMKMKFYPSVDFSYNLLTNKEMRVRLYTSYNSSLRMPSVTELYYSVGGYAADKHLKPEEVKAYELGAKLNSQSVNATLSLFHNRMTNLIDWIRDTNLGDEAVWKSVNFGKINSNGILLNLGYKPVAGSWVSRFLNSLNVAYSYIDQNKREDDGIQSQYVLEYLKHKVTLSADFSIYKNLSLTAFYRFQKRTGSYTATDGSVKGYKPYSIVDARMNYKAGKLNFYIEADNLLDTKYVDFGRIPQPGFWFIAGVIVNVF